MSYLAPNEYRSKSTPSSPVFGLACKEMDLANMSPLEGSCNYTYSSLASRYINGVG